MFCRLKAETADFNHWKFGNVSTAIWKRNGAPLTAGHLQRVEVLSFIACTGGTAIQ